MTLFPVLPAVQTVPAGCVVTSPGDGVSGWTGGDFAKKNAQSVVSGLGVATTRSAPDGHDE